MKIIERKFVRDECGRGWDCAQLEEWICGETLSSMFEIPCWVKTIWLSLHNRVASNRCSVKVMDDWDETFFLLFEEKEFASEGLDKVLKPFVGKTLHLQCEYEA